MIVNLERFIAEERPRWERLEAVLRRIEEDPWRRMGLQEARELDYLYRRASADLARIATFSAEPEVRLLLERLVARAYAEIHGGGRRGARFGIGAWLSVTLPQTFRRRIQPFLLACVLTLVGVVFGALAMAFDPDAKAALMPFEHLQESPAERVAREESMAGGRDRLEGQKTAFSAELMTHNIRVAIFALALGITCGVGTVILVFYNGVALGAVAIDYILGGEPAFLFGWLLPHGVIEIPAILVAAQAGFVLASALIGRNQAGRLGVRMKRAAPDIVTLIGGCALMLVWAGIMEAFLSQYHEPVLPYAVKIGLGIAEGLALAWYLAFAGRKREEKS